MQGVRALGGVVVARVGRCVYGADEIPSPLGSRKPIFGLVIGYSASLDSGPGKGMTCDSTADVRRGAPAVVFRDVTYSVQAQGGRKDILSGVSGGAEGGRMLAIMGGSGAGKTTLLDVLALRARTGRSRSLSGEVLLDGKPLTARRFADCAAYVAQEPLLWSTLTARETLEYAAELHGKCATGAERQAFVNGVLVQTGLASCQGTIVGDVLRKGLSGGQKKRLCVAEALMKRPTALFLDEPTSSLDSSSALELVRLFHGLAEGSGMLLLCTIHQPSHRIFELFEDVLLLAGGKVAYNGPSQEVLKHMLALGAPPLAAGQAIAEYLLELTNPDFVEAEMVDRIVDAWTPPEWELPCGQVAAEPVPRRSPLVQTAILSRRLALITMRDPTLYAGRWIFAIVGNALFSVVYIGARDRTQNEMLNRIWLFSWAMGGVAFLSVIVIAVYFSEFHIWQKERHNDMYRSPSYLASRLLVTVPASFVMSFCAFLPVAALVGLHWAGAPGILLANALLVMWSEFLAELLAATCPHYLLGMAAYILINFLTFLMAGNVVSIGGCTAAVRWLAYVNPWFYCIRAMVSFDFLGTAWDGFGVRGELCGPSPEGCFGSSGEDVLDSLTTLRSSFGSEHDPWFDVAMCFGIVVVTKLAHVVFVLAKL